MPSAMSESTWPMTPISNGDLTSSGGGSPGELWTRAFSAGDLLAQRNKRPKSRPFDASGPPEELLRPECSKGQLSLTFPGTPKDPSGRVQSVHYGSRSPSASQTRLPGESAWVSPSSRSRALDNWKMGESCRIRSSLQPTKYRQISLYGDAFQGFHNHDWRDVSHVQHLRAKQPLGRQSMEVCQGPFPQGPTQDQLRRNRNFDRSHGSDRFVGGFFQIGSQVIVP
jgi:hypothetical protein